MTGFHRPLYICVHVPEFPAQARLRLRREQARGAVAVVAGDPPLETVCSVNRRALAMGVAHGATRTELESFDDLTILRRSLPEERSARAALLTMAGAFTPRTQVRASVQPGKQEGPMPFAMVMDMSGSARLFGSTEQMVRAIYQAVRALGVYPRLAASANYHAAMCAASYARRAPLLLRPGCEGEGLARLPVTALELTEDQRSTFELWGLRTLGDLAALPEAELVTRMGQAGSRLWQLARGCHPHLMVPEEAELSLEEHVEFEAPEDRLEALLFVLGPMLDQIIRRAAEYALALASVTVRLSLEKGEHSEEHGPHVRTLKPALPINEREVWLKLLNLDLQAHPPEACVTELHLHAEAGKRGKVQAGLFSPALPEPMRLHVTLARIAALVGEERVGRACLRDTHSPEAFVMEHFTVPEQPARAHSVVAAATVRRMRPPVPLTMRLEGRTPARFFFRGKRYEITQAFGPWRRSGEWWSEGMWSREEWDIRAAAADGESLLCLVQQNLLASSWHLEALYD